MSGLLSTKPSPGSVRLAVGGVVLLFVQTVLMMLMPGIVTHLRMIIWLMTLVSGASFIGALVGLPDPPPFDRRCRHGR